MYTRRSLFVLLLIVTMSIAMFESPAQVLQVRQVAGLAGIGAWNIIPVKPNVLVGVDAELWIVRSDDAGRTWKRVDTTFKPRVNDIRFVDENRGYAACDSGKCLRTDDGGLTWTSSTASPNSSNRGISVCPLSHDTLVALFTNATGTVELLKSSDAGVSWEVITDFKDQQILGSLDLIRCFDSREWLVSYYSLGNRIILKTSDAGRTWEPKYGIYIGSHSSSSQDIVIVNDSVGFAALSYSESLTVGFGKTMDAGKTWTPVVLVPYDVNGRTVLSTLLSMNRNGSGIAVTNYEPSYRDEEFQIANGPIYSGEVRSTQDNWASWKEWPVERPPMYGFISSCIDEAGVVTVVGADNMVYQSSINDDTLRMITTRLADNYYDAMMITENTWILSGVVFVNRYSSYMPPRLIQNVLVRTTDAGLTWKSRIVDTVVLLSNAENDESQLLVEGNKIYRPKLEYADSETQFVTSGKILYRTNDAGETWDSIYTHEIRLQSVSFGDKTTGYALDTLKRLFRSTDGGLSFSIIPNLSSNIAAYCAVDSRLVFASDTGVNGKLRKSVDGGENWTSIELDSGGEITGMDVYDEDHIVLSRYAYYLSRSRGIVYHVDATTNGGAKWYPMEYYQPGQAPIRAFAHGQPRFRYLSASSILLSSSFDPIDYDRSSCDGGITWQKANLPFGRYKAISNVVSGSCLLSSVNPHMRVISGCGVAVGVEEIPEIHDVSIASRDHASCEILSREELRRQLEAFETTPLIFDMQGRSILHLDELVIPQTIFIRTGTQSRLVLVLH